MSSSSISSSSAGNVVEVNTDKKNKSKACRTCKIVSLVVHFMLPVTFALLYLFFYSVMPFYVLTMLTIVTTCISLSCMKKKKPKFDFFTISYVIFVIVTIIILSRSFFATYLTPYSDYEGFTLGPVSHNSLDVWVRSSTTNSVYASYRKTGETDLKRTADFTIDAERDFTTIVPITDLEPYTSYDLYMFNSDSTTSWFIESSFKTLRTPGSAGRIRFASTSCLMKAMKWNFQLSGLLSILDFNPDFSLLLGDLIYTDVPFLLTGLGSSRAESYYAKYRETYRDEAFRTFTTSHPVFHMYDDHEVLNDFDDDGKIRNEDLFNTAITHGWATYAGKQKGDGVSDVYYKHFEDGIAGFFIVDVHTFKNSTTLLGDVQLRALKTWLEESSSVFKFIASPSPWTLNFGSGKRSWAAYESTERKQLLELFQAHPRVILLSGDAHFAGVFQVAPGIFEVSASPIAAGGPPVNTFRIEKDEAIFIQPEVSMNRGNQFTIIDVLSEDEPRVEVQLYSSGDHWLNMTIYQNGSYGIINP